MNSYILDIETMADYDRLMTAIIKKQMSIIGSEFALKVARNVPGIEVDDKGNVTSSASKAKLRILVEEYKLISGELAVLFAKKAIQSLLNGKEDLPDELKS